MSTLDCIWESYCGSLDSSDMLIFSILIAGWLITLVESRVIMHERLRYLSIGVTA